MRALDSHFWLPQKYRQVIKENKKGNILLSEKNSLCITGSQASEKLHRGKAYQVVYATLIQPTQAAFFPQ